MLQWLQNMLHIIGNRYISAVTKIPLLWTNPINKVYSIIRHDRVIIIGKSYTESQTDVCLQSSTHFFETPIHFPI